MTYVRLLRPLLILLIGGFDLYACPAAAVQENVFLVDAKLEKALQVQTAAPTLPPNTLRVGREFRHEFKVLKVLFGQAGEGTLVLNFERQNWPAPGFNYLLIVKRTESGPVAEWWSVAENGLCVDPSTAVKLDVVGVVRNLQREYPCKDRAGDFVR
jgi:hypothetical protein